MSKYIALALVLISLSGLTIMGCAKKAEDTSNKTAKRTPHVGRTCGRCGHAIGSDLCCRTKADVAQKIADSLAAMATDSINK